MEYQSENYTEWGIIWNGVNVAFKFLFVPDYFDSLSKMLKKIPLSISEYIMKRFSYDQSDDLLLANKYTFWY